MSKEPKTKTQKQHFFEAARKLECDESEERFDKVLRTIGKQKPRPRLRDPHKSKRKSTRG